tara:strand:- start:288 stop:896 length:609 start_codon:yes stop_codon:yes gene_type:complete
MKEIFNHYKDKIESSNILSRLNLGAQNYMVASIHREENVDDAYNFENLMKALYALAETTGKKVLVSTHPRTLKKAKDLEKFADNSQVEFLKPFGFFDYIQLQKNAFCVLSDSGTITEESSLLGFPAVTLRNAHERPEGMDVGTLIMSGTEVDDLLKAVDVATKLGPAPLIPDYDVDQVSNQVLKIILSYTHYVNRYVWRKKI